MHLQARNTKDGDNARNYEKNMDSILPESFQSERGPADPLISDF